MGLAASIVYFANQLLGEPRDSRAEQAFVAVMIWASSIEGMWLGFWRAYVLRRIFPTMRGHQWIE